jgi:beta-lactamase class A
MRAVLFAAIGLSCAAMIGGELESAASGSRPQDHGSGEAPANRCVWPQGAYPSEAQVQRAAAFASGRESVAFAVIDRCGGLRGYDDRRPFSSASISKALLLAAYLRQRAEAPIPAADRALLRSMITLSDNDAGDAIYARVGDTGLAAVAQRAGMRDFEPTPGFWGGAQVTAADMARFFFGLEGNLPQRHRRYGMRLLASIVGPQRWGIPAAAGEGWRVWFKGGWRPSNEHPTSGPVTHQAALLRHSSGERVAIAVLTDDAPGSLAFGTIEGIAIRLLRPAPRSLTWAPG